MLVPCKARQLSQKVFYIVFCLMLGVNFLCKYLKHNTILIVCTEMQHVGNGPKQEFHDFFLVLIFLSQCVCFEMHFENKIIWYFTIKTFNITNNYKVFTIHQHFDYNTCVLCVRHLRNSSLHVQNNRVNPPTLFKVLESLGVQNTKIALIWHKVYIWTDFDNSQFMHRINVMMSSKNCFLCDDFHTDTLTCQNCENVSFCKLHEKCHRFMSDRSDNDCFPIRWNHYKLIL